MNRTLRLVATALLLLLTVSEARAQDAATGVVTGRVVDATGARARRSASRGDAHGDRHGPRDHDRLDRRARADEPRAGRVPGRLRGGGLRAEDVRSRRGAGRPPRVRRRGARGAGSSRGGRRGGERRQRAHGHLAGRRRRGGGRGREPAAQRPQLPRARVPDAGQRARAELRPDQDQRARDLGGRAARARRQHHDRRPGQQRRRRGRTARQPAAGRGPGVPDGDEPLLGRAGPLGGRRRERRHARRDGHAFGLGHVPAARRRAPGPARDFRPEHGRGASLQPPAVLGDARRADRARQGLVVRGGRVPQPGRGRADRHARRGHAHDPPDPGGGAARRLPGPGARRRAALRPGHARRALPGAGRGGHGRQHARPLDRLGLAAPGRARTATTRAS